MIASVNMPNKCAGCTKEIIYGGEFLPVYVAIDFRMSDFSTATISFCDDCAVKIGPEQFPALQEMIKRGWVIGCLISSKSKHEPVLARGIREQAASDWDGFAREYLPLRPLAANALENQKATHIKFNEDGQGIQWSRRFAFPILAMARFRVPTGDGASLRLIPEADLIKRVEERDG